MSVVGFLSGESFVFIYYRDLFPPLCFYLLLSFLQPSHSPFLKEDPF